MTLIIVSLISLAIGFGIGRIKSKATVTKIENTLDSFGAKVKSKL